MKNLITILIFTLLMLNSLLVKSQYTPLVIDSAHWIVKTCDGVALPPVGYAWEYYILGDTTVNAIQYKKVFTREWDNQFCNFGQPTSNTYSLFSLIREDTLTKKIYSTGGGNACPSGNDTLLYDFDLQIGDTFNTCLALGPIPIAIISQGNRFLSSTTYSGRGLFLYEGVGSYFGLFENIEMLLGSGGTVLSHYCRGGLSNCNILLSISNGSKSSFKFQLYPNPTNNQLTIDTELNINEITIIDITGKSVKTIMTNVNTVDVSNFTNGIYFIKLITDERTITKKFVKQ